MGRLQLFDDDNGGDDDDLSKLGINHGYAKRLEHNKKRADLHRYEELKKRGLVDDDSDEEEDELIQSSKSTDSKFFDALIKIKNQDPILKDKDAKLFDSDSDSDNESVGDENGNKEEEEEKKKKKKKKKKEEPMYLKDVVGKRFKHLIDDDAPEFDLQMEFDEDEEENEKMGNEVKSYSEEQEVFRRDFLKAVEEADNEEDDDFLREKNEGIKEEDEEEEEEEEEIGEKLDKVFGEDGALDADTKFLKDYFRHKMWLDDTKSKDAGDVEIELSEDEEEIEKQEDYERGFNFRFEENAGDRVMGHSRKVDGSVRKKENARKSQRERKEERMAQAEFERKEELKRLKNLKKKEINEKLEKIREVAGIGKDGNVILDVDDLEKEFDPEEHDRKMKEAFGDDYYEADDANPEFGTDDDEEKPDFDKEDELLGLPKGWDEAKESESDDDDNDGVDKSNEGKRKRKRKPSEVEKAVKEQLMEDYYKLDYEDTVGGLKMRFNYKPVTAKRFGLTPAEILMMDEKDLNQYVPLKKLAPYREKSWKVPRVKTLQFKEKIREQIGETSDSTKTHKKKRRVDDKEANEVVKAVEKGETESKEVNDKESLVSRRSKRRQRQNELKLSRSRHMAYGTIPSKSKSKKK